MTTRITKLGANQPADRFYRGGTRIAAFRRSGKIVEVDEDTLHMPEDWVASTTSLFGESMLGLTVLPEGGTFRDSVEANAEDWLGAEHVQRFGSDTGLLVKLLDAGERLPVHFHPDRAFSSAHLGLAHGKTEAWIALAPAEVAVAFKRDVELAEIQRWIRDQDSGAMLDAMHRIQMDAGDAVRVPAGLPHAIGIGAFFIELQEPTDLSILVEWEGYDLEGARDGHLNLTFDLALGALDRRGWPVDEVAQLKSAVATTQGALLPRAGQFFRADRVSDGQGWPAGMGVVIAIAGAGTLSSENEGVVSIRAGETLVVPYTAGSCTIEGDLEVVVCRPPLA